MGTDVRKLGGAKIAAIGKGGTGKKASREEVCHVT